MFIAASFVITRNLKQSRCFSNENGYRECGISTQWNTTHPLKKGPRELLMQMDRTTIMLSEVTQTQKDIHGEYSVISGY